MSSVWYSLVSTNESKPSGTNRESHARELRLGAEDAFETAGYRILLGIVKLDETGNGYLSARRECRRSRRA
jgi:hypothetical protein